MIVPGDTEFANPVAYSYETKAPDIDLLAYSGIRYNRFDTSAICSPTRAALITDHDRT